MSQTPDTSAQDTGAPGPSNVVLGVDVGGTNMRVGVIGADGTVLLQKKEPTPHDAASPEALLDLIGQVSAEAAEDFPGVTGCDVVMGLPGIIDYVERSLESGVNLPAGWVGAFKEEILEQQLGRDVLLANDADLAAVGEARFGAGRGHADVVYITISTGIGAGLILGDRLVAGRHSTGELGHTVLDLGGSLLGQSATVEELSSGTAMNSRANAAGLPTGADLTELVRSGDPEATAFFDNVIRGAGVGIANLCWLVAPSVVVIGGGLGLNTDLIHHTVRDALAEFGPPRSADEVVIARAALGDDAGLAGAAGWRAARGLG